MSKQERQLEASKASFPTAQQSIMARGEVEVPFSSFVETKEYRRFAQVCEASRRSRYMVVCVGDRGVGKTWAAREYAQRDVFGPLLSARGVRKPTLAPSYHRSRRRCVCHQVTRPLHIRY
jgi:hypothetical protein